jgi:hypothetical protein
MSGDTLVFVCKEVKSKSDFTKRSRSLDGLFSFCKPCQYTRNKQTRLNNISQYREKGKVYNRRKKLKSLGITEEKYNEIFESQNFVCAICKKEKDAVRDWHLDHNHNTGFVRGILCPQCNVMLGFAKDDSNTLRNAIEYLEKWKEH